MTLLIFCHKYHIFTVVLLDVDKCIHFQNLNCIATIGPEIEKSLPQLASMGRDSPAYADLVAQTLLWPVLYSEGEGQETYCQ